MGDLFNTLAPELSSVSAAASGSRQFFAFFRTQSDIGERVQKQRVEKDRRF